MTYAAERLADVGQIRKLLVDLEHRGLWKPANIPDQASIEGTKDEVLRILNLIETELERAGLWDRSIEPEEKVSDSDTGTRALPPAVTLEAMGRNAREAAKVIGSHHY